MPTFESECLPQPLDPQQMRLCSDGSNVLSTAKVMEGHIRRLVANWRPMKTTVWLRQHLSRCTGLAMHEGSPWPTKSSRCDPRETYVRSVSTSTLLGILHRLANERCPRQNGEAPRGRWRMSKFPRLARPIRFEAPFLPQLAYHLVRWRNRGSQMEWIIESYDRGTDRNKTRISAQRILSFGVYFRRRLPSELAPGIWTGRVARATVRGLGCRCRREAAEAAPNRASRFDQPLFGA